MKVHPQHPAAAQQSTFSLLVMKKKRTDSVEEASSLFFFDRRSSPGQGHGQAQQVQEQADVLLYWKEIKYPC